MKGELALLSFCGCLSGAVDVAKTVLKSFAKDILVANRDPYGEAWIVRVRPTGPESERAHLITGEEATKAYSEKITELEVHCFRCED